MTTTTLNNAQSIGTSTNVGKFAPVKTTAQAGTTAFTIAALFTAGDAKPEYGQSPIRVWYISSPFNITAAQAMDQLQEAAKFVEVRPPTYSGQGLITSRNSFIEPLQGSYVYTWIEGPNFATAGTITVTLVESP